MWFPRSDSRLDAKGFAAHTRSFWPETQRPLSPPHPGHTHLGTAGDEDVTLDSLSLTK